MTKTTQKIRKFCKEHPELSFPQVAKRLGISRSYVFKVATHYRVAISTPTEFINEIEKDVDKQISTPAEINNLTEEVQYKKGLIARFFDWFY